MRVAHLLPGLVVLTLVTASAVAPPAQAEEKSQPPGRVELELVSEPGFPVGGSAQWLKLLTDLGVTGLRIRGVQPGDKMGIEVRGTKQAPVYHVVGVLTSENTLRLPGRTFSPSQPKPLAEWLRRTALGSDADADKKVAFGLTVKQFAAVSDDLSARVGFETKGMTLGDVVARLKPRLKHPLSLDAAAAKALAGEERVRDELGDLSRGTALAAALRPAGLILLPREAGRQVELAITTSRGAKELWPVGWQSEQAPAKLVPPLAETINVEIEETPLSEALEAVGRGLKAPLLLDHNTLAEHDIDADKARVKLPAGRIIYSTVLRKLLYQAKLRYEVRVDDAGKAFLWITYR
jgi:hypothetical protein